MKVGLLAIVPSGNSPFDFGDLRFLVCLVSALLFWMFLRFAMRRGNSQIVASRISPVLQKENDRRRGFEGRKDRGQSRGEVKEAVGSRIVAGG
jgi:hypothetical protein